MKAKILLPLIAIPLIVLGYSSMYIVDETQQVILIEFGKPIGNPIQEPGLYFKLPYREVRYFDKRILNWDGEPNEVPTNDKTFIWVDTTARWKIVDPLVFLQRLGNENRAQIVLNNLIDGAVRDLVTKNDLIEIILSSDWKEEYSVSTEAKRKIGDIRVGRDNFSNLIKVALAEEMRKNGIVLLDVLINRLNYTEKVRSRVYDRMISERKRIASRLRSEGEGAKANILGEMDRELKSIESEAFRKSEEIRGEADAKALELYGEAHSVDPEFFSFYMTLENYRDMIGKNTKLVIDSESDIYRLLKSKDL